MIKKVMKNYYVHKSNWKELLNVLIPYEIRVLVNVMENYDGDFEYDIIKFDTLNNKISFIESPDWDMANEPIVGDSHIYDMETDSISHRKGRKNNPQIYHNKWMFVADDYNGFDIEQSKRRTEEWNNIPNINEHKSKIGNRNYWIELLKLNGMEI